MGIETPSLSHDIIEFMTNYDWTGNVRELKNVIQRLLFIADTDIKIEHIQQAIIPALKKDNGTGSNYFDRNNIITWKELERDIKYKYFKFVRDNSSSDAETATKLGLAPPNYFRMSKELGLK